MEEDILKYSLNVMFRGTPCSKKVLMSKIDTELPTKDETSETIVLILCLCFLIFMILYNYNTYHFFIKLLNKPFKD